MNDQYWSFSYQYWSFLILVVHNIGRSVTNMNDQYWSFSYQYWLFLILVVHGQYWSSSLQATCSFAGGGARGARGGLGSSTHGGGARPTVVALDLRWQRFTVLPWPTATARDPSVAALDLRRRSTVVPRPTAAALDLRWQRFSVLPQPTATTRDPRRWCRPTAALNGAWKKRGKEGKGRRRAGHAGEGWEEKEEEGGEGLVVEAPGRGSGMKERWIDLIERREGRELERERGKRDNVF